jgi:hypothetical protein
MPVFFQQVAIGWTTAGVPALTDALLHPATAALDQITHVPLRDALLDPSCEDRRCAGRYWLIGGKQPYVTSFELTLNTRRIRRDPRETIYALDDHSEQRLPMVGSSQQVGQTALPRNRDP